MSVNLQAALDEVNNFIALIDARNHDHTVLGRAKLDEELTERLTLVKVIGDRIYPGLTWQTASLPDRKWHWIRESLVRLRGWIHDMHKASAILGPTGPQLSASRLHSWVWDAAVSLWDSKNFRQAIHAAATNVEEQLKGKLDRYDVSGTALLNEAFSSNEASEGHPRLRFTSIDPERLDDWNSAHDGARAFGAGCMLAIRNLATHGTSELPEQEALERLSALSVLARMIDAAEVMRIG